jgi:uncharacterized protein YdbL (DUF1318 family)
MVTRFARRLAAIAALFLVLALAAPPAEAQSLDALRASGAVGERFDGYAVARDGSAAAVVQQVNAKRQQIYQQRAAATGAPADEVGKVYAQEIFAKAPPGTWLQQPNGQWVQK